MTSVRLAPADARLDQPVRLTLTGLPPRSQVTVRLRALTLRAEASATVRADDTGIMHIAEPMRLFTGAAWTHRGQPLPFIPPRYDPEGLKQFAAAAASGRPIAMTPGFLRLLEGAALETVTIPVERTTGPILLMSAGDDQVWPSTVLAEIALARLRANVFPFPVEYLTYPEAGHFACLPPYIPTTMTWSRHPLTPFAMELGGSPQANAEAAADLWPRIVAFLAGSLAPAAFSRVAASRAAPAHSSGTQPDSFAPGFARSRGLD